MRMSTTAVVLLATLTILAAGCAPEPESSATGLWPQIEPFEIARLNALAQVLHHEVLGPDLESRDLRWILGGQPIGNAVDRPVPRIAPRSSVADLAGRNIQPPVLLRFQDVLNARVRKLNQAFDEAIEAADYDSVYRSVYPIKVNQLHEVVEEVLEAGKVLVPKLTTLIHGFLAKL